MCPVENLHQPGRAGGVGGRGDRGLRSGYPGDIRGWNRQRRSAIYQVSTPVLSRHVPAMPSAVVILVLVGGGGALTQMTGRNTRENYVG
jgi:hypothetical protein